MSTAYSLAVDYDENYLYVSDSDNSRIQRFINPSKSFPIEESFINLAIVNVKELQKKEKKLRHAIPETGPIPLFPANSSR